MSIREEDCHPGGFTKFLAPRFLGILSWGIMLTAKGQGGDCEEDPENGADILHSLFFCRI